MGRCSLLCGLVCPFVEGVAKDFKKKLPRGWEPCFDGSVFPCVGWFALLWTSRRGGAKCRIEPKWLRNRAPCLGMSLWCRKETDETKN